MAQHLRKSGVRGSEFNARFQLTRGVARSLGDSGASFSITHAAAEDFAAPLVNNIFWAEATDDGEQL